MAGDALGSGAATQRLSVFIDYQFVYRAAREAFAPSDRQVPAAFGNVVPTLLAHTVVASPPPWRRRSERSLSRVDVVVPEVTPATPPSMVSRIDRWRADGSGVYEAPQLPAPSWRIARAVLLCARAFDALAAEECDTVVLAAGEPGLLPLVRQLLGSTRAAGRIELLSWVSPSGVLLNALATAEPRAWCHRLGKATFARVADHRRR